MSTSQYCMARSAGQPARAPIRVGHPGVNISVDRFLVAEPRYVVHGPTSFGPEFRGFGVGQVERGDELQNFFQGQPNVGDVRTRAVGRASRLNHTLAAAQVDGPRWTR